MQAFIDECTLYPRGKHDDLLDGFFYANKNSYKPHHEASERQEQEDFVYFGEKNWKTM